MWLCVKRKSEWKKRENNIFYYFIRWFILYYVIELYIKIKTRM